MKTIKLNPGKILVTTGDEVRELVPRDVEDLFGLLDRVVEIGPGLTVGGLLRLIDVDGAELLDVLTGEDVTGLLAEARVDCARPAAFSRLRVSSYVCDGVIHRHVSGRGPSNVPADRNKEISWSVSLTGVGPLLHLPIEVDPSVRGLEGKVRLEFTLFDVVRELAYELMWHGRSEHREAIAHGLFDAAGTAKEEIEVVEPARSFQRRVILFHGKDGSPGSTKSKALANEARSLDWEVIFVDHTATKDPERRLQMAREKFADVCREPWTVLVGSSMGGYVAAALANEFDVAGLFLMAPALYMPGYAIQRFEPKTQNITIVHGRDDAVVPIDNSRQFATDVRATRLVEVSDDHRLEGQLSFLRGLLRAICGEVDEERHEVAREVAKRINKRFR